MKVEVQLYATLSKYLPKGSGHRKAVMECVEGTTVRHLIERLGIPTQHPNMVLVNGLHADPDVQLKDGDVLSVFPPLAGGRQSRVPDSGRDGESGGALSLPRDPSAGSGDSRDACGAGYAPEPGGT
jgi:molybdopterin converting factor small subunit